VSLNISRSFIFHSDESLHGKCECTEERGYGEVLAGPTCRTAVDGHGTSGNWW